MEQPLVSVVIPFYSGQKWLYEALNSVQSQTYENIEVLVINDGSKEDISDINKMYDMNITIVNKENGGPASARNLGIEKSSGKYIAFLDSDDLWLPEKLTQQIGEMESKGYVWCHHSYEMFWDGKSKTKLIDTKQYSGNVLKDCYISFKVQSSCVVVLREILIATGIRFPDNKRYGEDLDFYRELAQCYPLGYVEGVFSMFRIRGQNAGFRAKVQIFDKATTWLEIKENVSITKILPRPIIFAYRTLSLSSKCIDIIHKKFIKSEKEIEFISKILYLLPYILFKLCSRDFRNKLVNI